MSKVSGPSGGLVAIASVGRSATSDAGAPLAGLEALCDFFLAPLLPIYCSIGMFALEQLVRHPQPGGSYPLDMRFHCSSKRSLHIRTH